MKAGRAWDITAALCREISIQLYSFLTGYKSSNALSRCSIALQDDRVTFLILAMAFCRRLPLKMLRRWWLTFRSCRQNLQGRNEGHRRIAAGAWQPRFRR